MKWTDVCEWWTGKHFEGDCHHLFKDTTVMIPTKILTGYITDIHIIMGYVNWNLTCSGHGLLVDSVGAGTVLTSWIIYSHKNNFFISHGPSEKMSYYSVLWLRDFIINL